MGLDVGSRTIGLALSDEGRMVATSWETWARKGQKEDAKELVRRASVHDVSAFVVGWPLELDGRVGQRARRVQVFIDALELEIQTSELEVSVSLWDERFSTAAAQRAMIEADMSRAKRKAKIDALAAQVILQGWLDAQPSPKNEKNEVAG